MYDRDFEYDYFGFKTLERSYLMRCDGDIAERPQHMIMRVAIGIHGQDVRSRRLHQRMDYVEVGRIRHTKVGPFRFNRVEFRPGLHPTEDPIGPVPAPSDSPVV